MLIPQNKGIILVALGATLIICTLLDKDTMAFNIMVALIALVNPTEQEGRMSVVILEGTEYTIQVTIPDPPVTECSVSVDGKTIILD